MNIHLQTTYITIFLMGVEWKHRNILHKKPVKKRILHNSISLVLKIAL